MAGDTDDDGPYKHSRDRALGTLGHWARGSDGKIFLPARPTQSARSLAKALQVAAWCSGETVRGSFNQFTFLASPGSTLADIMEPFSSHQWRTKFGDDRYQQFREASRLRSKREGKE